MEYVLGIDMGETSIGWAVVEILDDSPRRIADLGVRIFPAGAKVDEKKGSQSTLSQERRLKRSMRRNLARRRNRKIRLRTNLEQAGLWPKEEREQAALLAMDPYQLRAKALDEGLSLHEIGRAFIHLNQKRGFKSNRQDADQGKKKDDGIVAPRAQALGKDMQEKAARTLGEYYHTLNHDPVARCLRGEALRNRQSRYERHATRAMVEEEFNAIWDAQKQHHPKVLTGELYRTLHSDIFFQQTFALTPKRRALWPDGFVNAKKAPQLARCPLFPDEFRSASGTWWGQRFRLLKELNNLRVLNEVGESRELTPHERFTLLSELGYKKTMKFNAMRKSLKLADTDTFNLEAGKRDSLKGNEIEHDIVKAVYGKCSPKEIKAWELLPEGTRHNIRWAIENIEDDEAFERWAREHSYSAEQIENLRSISPSSGYLAYSEKAIAILAPLMEDGLDEYHAIQKAVELGMIPRPQEMDVQPKLPLPPDLPNPVVKKALFEVRKIVNALIGKYGRPQKIVVELAREVKNGPSRRQEMSKQREENEKRNKIAADWYREHGVSRPSRNDLIAYKLWEDQRGRCGYTGKAIPAEWLLAENRYVEVDHIIPYSRSLDDSYNNKVLCLTVANREKGNRTPVEWLGGEGSPRYDEMMTTLKHMGVPKGKLVRFRQAQINQEEMIARQLVDSQYMSREVSKYLACLYEPDLRVGQKVIHTIPGMLTATLRRFWGINSILGDALDDKKNRTDHRHHAVDAAVIACANRKHVKQLAVTSSRNLREQQIDPPWATFRDDLEDFTLKRERVWKLGEKEITTEGIIVSHRPDRKIRGGFHEATNYGPTAEANVFAYRKDVSSLTWPMIGRIRDNVVRSVILEHLRSHGIEEGKQIPPKVWQETLYMPTKSGELGPPIRKVRLETTINAPIIFTDSSGKAICAAESGNNHHVEIIETLTGTKQGSWSGRFVPMFEAAKRVRREKRSPIDRSCAENERFVMSLSRNDALATPEGDTWKIHRVQKMTVTGSIILRPNSYAGQLKDTDKPPIIVRKSPNTLQGSVKASVSPIGELSLAND